MLGDRLVAREYNHVPVELILDFPISQSDDGSPTLWLSWRVKRCDSSAYLLKGKRWRSLVSPGMVPQLINKAEDRVQRRSLFQCFFFTRFGNGRRRRRNLKVTKESLTISFGNSDKFS